jgi:glycosyltransferase involved in cell wall biosynthesis
MSESVIYSGRLAVQQRVLPIYRVPFFEQLARSSAGGFSLFAGKPRPVEAIKTADALIVGEIFEAENRHLFRGPLYLCYQPNIFEWLESWQPDALVVEANSRYPNTRDAVRWMHARGRPVLGWGLGSPTLMTGPLAGIRSVVRARFLSQLDGIIAYSERGAAQYRALGIPDEQVFVAHNAAAPRPTSPPPERPADPERNSILFVGRLQARKRLEMLFKACAVLPENQQPDVIIVGDGPARSEFESQAQAIYPRAEFVGAVHGPDLTPYYARADLFVLPGTGGLAVQQAMSHGLPVIVAEGDGTQADLVRPESGWMVRPGDQADLNAALAEALSDIPRLRTLGAEAYRITTEEINLEQMAASFLKAVGQVASNFNK